MWQLHTKKIDLEGQLMWQLRNKNNIFSKTEIQLSSTIGQGNTLFSTHSTLLSLSLSVNDITTNRRIRIGLQRIC